MAPRWPAAALLPTKAPRRLVFLFTLSLSVTYLFYSLLSCYTSLQFPLQEAGLYLQPDSPNIRTASLRPDSALFYSYGKSPEPGASSPPGTGAFSQPKPGASSLPKPRASSPPEPGASSPPKPGASSLPETGASSSPLELSPSRSPSVHSAPPLQKIISPFLTSQTARQELTREGSNPTTTVSVSSLDKTPFIVKIQGERTSDKRGTYQVFSTPIAPQKRERGTAILSGNQRFNSLDVGSQSRGWRFNSLDGPDSKYPDQKFNSLDGGIQQPNFLDSPLIRERFNSLGSPDSKYPDPQLNSLDSPSIRERFNSLDSPDSKYPDPQLNSLDSPSIRHSSNSLNSANSNHPGTQINSLEAGIQQSNSLDYPSIGQRLNSWESVNSKQPGPQFNSLEKFNSVDTPTNKHTFNSLDGADSKYRQLNSLERAIRQSNSLDRPSIDRFNSLDIAVPKNSDIQYNSLDIEGIEHRFNSLDSPSIKDTNQPSPLDSPPVAYSLDSAAVENSDSQFNSLDSSDLRVNSLDSTLIKDTDQRLISLERKDTGHRFNSLDSPPSKDNHHSFNSLDSPPSKDIVHQVNTFINTGQQLNSLESTPNKYPDSGFNSLTRADQNFNSLDRTTIKVTYHRFSSVESAPVDHNSKDSALIKNTDQWIKSLENTPDQRFNSLNRAGEQFMGTGKRLESLDSSEQRVRFPDQDAGLSTSGIIGVTSYNQGFGPPDIETAGRVSNVDNAYSPTTKQTISTSDSSTILSQGLFSTSDSANIRSRESLSTSDSAPVPSQGRFSTSDSAPNLSRFTFSTSDSANIQSRGSFSTSDSANIQSRGSFSTSDSAPKDWFSTSDGANIQSREPFTSDSAPIPSQYQFSTSDSANIRSLESFSTSDSAPIRSSDPFSTSDRANIRYRELFSSSESAPILSGDPFSSSDSDTSPLLFSDRRSKTLDSSLVQPYNGVNSPDTIPFSDQRLGTPEEVPIQPTDPRYRTSDQFPKTHSEHWGPGPNPDAGQTTPSSILEAPIKDFSSVSFSGPERSYQHVYDTEGFTGDEMRPPWQREMDWERAPIDATEMNSPYHTGYLEREAQESSTTDEELSRRLTINSTVEYGDKRLPQAIIIGVKKGGTRALLEALRAHPDVRAVGVEPHFFDRNYEKGLEWYRDLMPRTIEGQITMEKTPSYFVTNDAPQRIHSMAKDTKLIVVVRNPVTRAISDYTQTLSKKPEIPSFEVLAFKNRTLGLIDSSWSALRIGIYALHLESWMQYFPLSQILFVSGEHLITNPAEELAKVQEFLGLQRIITEKYFHFNKTKGFPCLKKPEDTGAPRCLGKSKGRTHPKIDPDVIQRLRKFYKPFNAMFYQMTGQDFQWEKEELEG